MNSSSCARDASVGWDGERWPGGDVVGQALEEAELAVARVVMEVELHAAVPHYLHHAAAECRLAVDHLEAV